MKNTAFTHIHEGLGAKMAPFAGYNMPIQYTGVKDEHFVVREKVGVFDVSHMGEFIVKGPEALDLIQYITSNDASALVDGKVQYSCFPNGKGGIVDDLLVYQINNNEFMLVVNASNIDKDLAWVNANNKFEASVENISDEISLLAIQGPKAVEALQKLTSVNLSEIGYYTFKIGEFAGFENIIISATGYTGAGGFEIYMPNSAAESIWNQVFEAGKEFGIQPAGLAARDTLRLEMGFCLYGNDINDSTSPIEAGLGWITKFKDHKDFIDKDTLLNQKTNGTTRKLIGFTMADKAIPRKDYPIVDANGNEIGVVTSGTMAPSLNQGIGMGYVSTEYLKEDSTIYISIRNKQAAATITKLPFYKG